MLQLLECRIVVIGYLSRNSCGTVVVYSLCLLRGRSMIRVGLFVNGKIEYGRTNIVTVEN